MQQIYEIKRTELFLQDLPVSFDSLTELEDSSVFTVQLSNQIFPATLDEELIQGVLIQMNMDKTIVTRTGYTILDVLADVGGLLGILTSGIGLLLGIWNFKIVDQYMASKLFKVAPAEASAQDPISATPVTPSNRTNCLEFFIDRLIPCKLACCCKRSRQQLAMEKAREALEKEVDIIQIIRSNRLVHTALMKLLGDSAYRELKARSQFEHIDLPR